MADVILSKCRTASFNFNTNSWSCCVLQTKSMYFIVPLSIVFSRTLYTNSDTSSKTLD